MVFSVWWLLAAAWWLLAAGLTTGCWLVAAEKAQTVRGTRNIAALVQQYVENRDGIKLLDAVATLYMGSD